METHRSFQKKQMQGIHIERADALPSSAIELRGLYGTHKNLPRAARDGDLVCIIPPTSDVLGWY